MSQVRVTTAAYRKVADQAGGQGTKAVVEHQNSACFGQLLRMQLFEQVLIGGIEGLQRVVGLVRLADQVEFGVRGGQQGHGVWLGYGSAHSGSP